MKNLNKFVEQANNIRALFNDPPLTLDTQADMQTIYDRLDTALSPENLSMDGELRGAKLQAKRKYLTNAKAELEALAAERGFTLVAYTFY